MIKLLLVFAAALALAYISEQNTKATLAAGYRYSVWNDWAYLLLVTLLVLFTGLRTSYNDTWNYIRGYMEAPTLGEFLTDPENLNIFGNPLFYVCQSILKGLGFGPHMLIFSASLITQACFMRFFKQYSCNFTFSVFIYFTLGTFLVSMAAMKQVLAMGILTLAIPYLEKRQWGMYYLIVFLAMLIHTYAAVFAVLPLFAVKPWRMFTFTFVALFAVLMLNFTEAITKVMEQVNQWGKNLEEYEVFDNHTVNSFRVAVYSVTPLLTLILSRWVFHKSSKIDYVIVHMSIISLAFMIMGTRAGANMFARMAHYFELGTICCLPWVLEKSLDKRSYKLVCAIAIACFFGFFVYANRNFGDEYQAIGLFGLF